LLQAAGWTHVLARRIFPDSVLRHMSQLLKAFCVRYAPRVRANGVVMLTHDGDPLLAAAFKELGWSDQKPEHAINLNEEEAATVRDHERAVIKRPRMR
jgi:hypothetical protein